MTRQFYQTSSTGESTTASTSYQDKATLTFTPDANSTYLLLATWFQGQASATRVSYVQLYDATGSATLNVQVVNQSDADDYIPGGCAIHVSFGSSPSEQTYKIQYKSGGATNAKIKQVRLIAIKLGSNDQTASSTDRSTYATDTSLQDKVSKTFTPGSAGDYLILASAVYDASRNNYDATVQIDVDGSTQYGSLTTRVTNSANRHGYLYFQKVTLTAASHTIKIRYATGNNSSTVGIAYAYLTLLRLSDFEGIVSASQDTEQSDTDGTKDHALTADFSSAAAKDHLILACGLQTTSSGTSGGKVGLYEGTTDLGTDRIVPQYTGKYYPYFGSYYTTDPANTYYVDVQTENASYATKIDDIRIYGLQLTAAVQNVTSSDSLLLKLGTESSLAPAATIPGTDTLLLKLGTESSLAPAATIPGTDALLITMGAETGGIAATLAASDTLLVTYLTETGTVLGTITNVSASDTLLLALSDTSVSIYEILYPTASDTLLLALSDTSASPAGAVSAADTLLLKYGTESGNYSYDLSAADTLLLKYGTESSLYPAATIPGTDILYIGPDIEGFDLVAAISASDTLLIDPDYDVGYVGNVHGACEATVRAIHAKARITYSDPSLNEAVTITATDTAEGTDPYDTADNITGSDYTWFSLQENDLSGDYHAMPDSVGWWSATLSDANGEFSPGMVLTVEMESPRPIYSLKVYGDDKLDNYPVDFTVKLYDDSDTLLYTETVTGNTLWNWEKTLTSTIADVAKMVLTITKISQAARSAIVTEFYTAYYEDYTDSDIMYMSVLEERDYSGGTLPIGNVSSNEIVLRLNNADNHFSVDNESSEIYDIMKKNRRIEAWIGVEVPYGGEVTWEKIGTFWSQDWSTPQDEVYAEVVGFDRLELLRNTEFYSSQVYEDYTLSQLAALILTDAGLSASEYSIHSSLASITIPYAWFDRTTHRDALIEIAEAIGGTVYCDRDGLIVITPYADEATPSYTLSSDLYFTKDQPLAFSEIVNYVEVRAKPRSPGTQEVIYSDTESLVVPGAVDGVNGEAERWCIFNASDPCIDVQTATGTATGGTITLKSQVDYSWATLLTYQNTNVEAGTVTDIEIQGKVLGITGEKVAIAQDADSIRLNGKQALSEPIENEFIQTMARAQTIANALLAAYKDPRRDVVVQARGYTMSRLGERMTVQSLDGSVSNDYTITRQQIEYDGGLRVEMTGQKIPEA